jgi:TldD protein
MTDTPISLVDRAGLDRSRLAKIVSRGLDGADDGELFLEYRQAEALTFDNGRLKQATYDTSQGFGLRAVKDEAVGYAHASDVSESAIERAADAVQAVKGGYSGHYAAPPPRSNVKLYGEDSPLQRPSFEAKSQLLQTIDAYARAKDPRVRQVTASLAASWQGIEILRGDGEAYRDIRPMVRVNVSVVVGDGNRQETALSPTAPGKRRWTMRYAKRSSISRRYRRPPAKWMWCSAPAGRASCCTKRSATGWKEISTARRPQPSPA